MSAEGSVGEEKSQKECLDFTALLQYVNDPDVGRGRRHGEFPHIVTGLNMASCGCLQDWHRFLPFEINSDIDQLCRLIQRKPS